MYQVFDIGGSFIKYGLIDKNGEIREKIIKPTPEGYSDLLEILRSLAGSANALAITLSLPGVYDKRLEKLIYAPNLRSLIDRHIVKDLGIKKDIFVENDGNLAALGEYCYGFAEKPESLVFFTLGTGVGGGFIQKGKLYSSRITAMELGHTTVAADGRLCGCGKRGCLEKYCSASALAIDYTDALEAEGRKAPDELTPLYIANQVDAGDFAAFAAFDHFALHLAHSVSSVINIFNPEAVRIGGGLSELSKYYLPRAKELLKELVFPPFRGYADVREAKLKNDAALLGGVEWIKYMLGEK